MEQDIKNLQEIINLCNEELDNKDENVTAVLDLTDLLSLRNFIKAYKELEELKNNKVLIRRYFDLKDNSIPVSLVEEKIEEILNNNEYRIIFEGDAEFPNDATIIKAKKYIEMSVLEELLEKRK